MYHEKNYGYIKGAKSDLNVNYIIDSSH